MITSAVAVLRHRVRPPIACRRRRSQVGTPALRPRIGRTGGRVDAEHRDAVLHEVLEQVAVVARDLDHEALAVRAPVCDQAPGRYPASGPASWGERRDSRGSPGRTELPAPPYRSSCTSEQSGQKTTRSGKVGSESSRFWMRDKAVGQRRDAEVQEREQRPAAARPASFDEHGLPHQAVRKCLAGCWLPRPAPGGFKDRLPASSEALVDQTARHQMLQVGEALVFGPSKSSTVSPTSLNR